MSNSNEPPRAKEATGDRAVRSTKNVFQRCIGCLQTSDDKAKIKFKEIKIANRQKTFGVLYIDMVRNKSTEEELKKALDDCIVDVEALVKEIEQIEIEIDKVNKDTEAKIQLEPGTPAPVPAAKPDENESKMEAEPETPDKMEAKPETPDNKTAPTAEI